MKSLRLAPETKKSVEIENREEFTVPIAHQVSNSTHQAGLYEGICTQGRGDQQNHHYTAGICHFPAGQLI